MAFEPSYKTLETSYRKFVEASQQKVEYKLNAEPEKKIAKILCAKIETYISSAQALNKEATFAGGNRFEVVYLAEDGSFNTLTADDEFVGKLENPKFNEDEYLLPKSQVVDAQIEGVQPDMVKLSGIIDIRIDAIQTDEVEYIEKLPENVVTKTEKINYCSLSSAQKSRLDIAHEYEIKEDIGKLLMATADVCCQAATPGTDYVTFKGKVKLNLTYETAGEEKEIKSTTQSFDFTEEVESNTVTPDSIVTFISTLKYDDINVVGNNIDGTTVINANLTLLYDYVILKSDEVEAVVDAFAIDENINLTSKSFTKCKFNDFSIADKTVTNTVTVDEPIESIEADCGGAVFVANVYTEKGNVVSEGVARVNVIYYTLDGEDEENQLKYNSVLVEMPFSIDTAVIQATENSNAQTCVGYKDLSIRRKRSREIEVEADICTYTETFETQQDALISKAESVDAELEENNALRMFAIAKGSTMWDICKQVKAKPETIMEQNPGLDFPLAEDTVIIIYKPKQEKY